MKRIIVHIGLPKTATTTLQHDLFQKLHDEGEINFLGKTLDYDLVSRKVTWYNQTGQIIRQACEGKIEEDVSAEIDRVLVEDKVNIFSDEGLSVYYPGLENLSLEDKVHNLKRILSNYDTTIVITLRNPLDYMYSLYVQLYSDFFFKISKLNSFKKYARHFLKNQDDIMFESLNYESYLDLLKCNFDLKVLLYEDLVNNKDLFYRQLSEFFALDHTRVRELLDGRHRNKKDKKKGGVSKVRSYNNVVSSFIKFFAKDSVLYNLFKRIYRFSNLKQILTKNHTSRGVHRMPRRRLRKKIIEYLSLSGDFCAKDYGINEQSLLKYKYL